MTPYQIERIEELEEDVKDCEKSLKNEEDNFENAKKWLEKSKVNYAEAIIKLYNVKKEYEKTNI